ncbi:ATPase [Betaproteobacteria bacterium]|nr:ATPase [Betaproteobacteria bacterium]
MIFAGIFRQIESLTFNLPEATIDSIPTPPECLMIPRAATPYLQQLAREFRIVALTGPRQSGKTTLARAVFPGHAYVNLEEPDIRQLAAASPRDFFTQFRAPLIIDEVQRVPELLSYLQVLVDQEKQNGQYILTGSHQPRLKAEVSQSLAGRVALLPLLPFSIAELSAVNITCDRDEYIYRGFLPRIYDESVTPTLLYRNYYQTYIERDVRQMVNISNQRAFEVFVRLLAGRIGQLVNFSALAGEVGVSAPTLSAWFSALEASHLVFRLPPYFRNFGKRLVKTPKVYFTDVGLAAYLLGIRSSEQVFQHPQFGGLFENMVVLEALKARCNAGKDPDLYFFRDAHGLEVDLLLAEGQGLTPIEIKATRTFAPELGNNLQSFLSLVDNADNATVLYAGALKTSLGNVTFRNFAETGMLVENPLNLNSLKKMI